MDYVSRLSSLAILVVGTVFVQSNAAQTPIQFSPASISLAATAGASTAVKAQLQISSSTAESISVSAYGTANNRVWLSVSPSGSGRTPETVTVSANPAGLAAGSYSGSIRVRANGTTYRASVAFTISAQKTFTATPATVSCKGTAGATTATSQSISVSASPNTSFTASASGGSWLSLSAASGTTPASLVASCNPGTLSSGSYTGSISLVGNGITNTIPVTFNVNPAASLTVTPTALSFSAIATGASPAPQTVSISANPSTTFTASVGGSPWLVVSPASGATPATLTISPSVSGLSAGSYVGTVNISASNGLKSSVSVAFTVAAPTLTVGATSLSFSAYTGGSSPSAQAFTISANPVTTFTATSSGGSWLTVAPATGSTPNTLTVGANVIGLSAGNLTGAINIKTANGLSSTVPVTFNVMQPTLTSTPTSLSYSLLAGGTSQSQDSFQVAANPNATINVTTSGISWLTASPSSTTTPATITVTASVSGVSAGTYTGAVIVTGSGLTNTIPVTVVVGSAGTSGPFKVVGWNDLGMHCFDGKDYSIFGVLPPYNTIHAHLIDTNGALVVDPSTYTLDYQAITDPFTGEITTTAADKSNYWDYSGDLGLGSPAPDIGITGNAMPGKANKPQPMTFSTSDNTWAATGIPEFPYTDKGTTNYFPMMRVTARNSSGQVLATTDIVLPTSDEMTCLKCHASNSNSNAMPKNGWANNPNLPQDVKINILRRHDDDVQATALFQSAAIQLGYNPAGLEASARSKPILCAQCHGSNALEMSGVTGINALTQAMHRRHAPVVDPLTGATMDSSTDRATCYSCHPGPKTQCTRGAMAILKDTNGNNLIQCQSCHGNLTAVANPSRTGWLSEPTCQSCHTGLASANNTTLAYTSSFSSGTTYRTPVDSTFATNANTPSAGLSMYRFSKGHGGLQCESCHGSTHAEFPTSIPNDNIQSINLQGHAGTLAECSACHKTVPSTTNGGPHGLHPIGTSWVSQHQNVAERGTAVCQGCHGTDYRGTILSRVRTNRTMAGKTFAAGTIIGCYSCHNGPNGD